MKQKWVQKALLSSIRGGAVEVAAVLHVGFKREMLLAVGNDCNHALVLESNNFESIFASIDQLPGPNVKSVLAKMQALTPITIE